MATTWMYRQGILQCRRRRRCCGEVGLFGTENSAAVVSSATGRPALGTTAPHFTTMWVGGGAASFGKTATTTTTFMPTTRPSRRTTFTSTTHIHSSGGVGRIRRADTQIAASGRNFSSDCWLWENNNATGTRPSRGGYNPTNLVSVFSGGSQRHESSTSTTSASAADVAQLPVLDDNKSKSLDNGKEKEVDGVEETGSQVVGNVGETTVGLDEDVDENHYRFMDYGQDEFDLEDEDETDSDDEEDGIVEEDVNTGSLSGGKVDTNLRQKNIAAGRRHLRRIQAGKESDQQEKSTSPPPLVAVEELQTAALEQQTASTADAADDENAEHTDDDDGNADDKYDDGYSMEKDEFGDNGMDADEGESAGDDDQNDDDEHNQFLSDPATEVSDPAADDKDDWQPDEDTVLELMTAEAPAKKQERKRGKYNKAKHRGNFIFEAVPLFVDTIKNSGTDKTEDVHEGSSVAKTNLASSTSLADRVVLVDNLPIDITVEELDRLYSRFGSLESIRIFNQRPDLDPGPLTKMQQKERLNRQIRSVGLHNCRWRRPCSPVHALLTYVESNAGALDEALRIFGMILYRHPARSIPATDLTRLYIENLPATLHNNDKPVTAIEVEHWLTQQLDPDHYLCLGAGQSYSSLVGSCELWFPNFEHAYQAFVKLERMDVFQDETNQCRVHWRRSPPNAHKWWTREIGFN